MGYVSEEISVRPRRSIGYVSAELGNNPKILNNT